MTTLYLAGRYSRRDELREYAAVLREAGYVADPAWLREEHDWDGVDPLRGQRLAQDDIRDILDADRLLAFTDGPGTTRRGGRHVEVGIALGLGIAVDVIGPAENVFHLLPTVTRYHDFEDWLLGYRLRGIDLLRPAPEGLHRCRR